MFFLTNKKKINLIQKKMEYDYDIFCEEQSNKYSIYKTADGIEINFCEDFNKPNMKNI